MNDLFRDPEKLDISALENWLWDIACVIRGPVDAPKFKDYILPLIFLKRLCDVFDDELRELGDIAKFVDKDPHLVRFYIPQNARWDHLSQLTTGLGEALTDAVRGISRYNPKLQGVIDNVDFNATAQGQRILSDSQLKEVINRLSRYRLGLKDVEPDILGRAYEYLLRKFAEGSGQSAGEFYTPREVAILMSYILDPEPGETIYDPACGSGGLLIKCYLRFLEKYGQPNDTGRLKVPSSIEPLHFFGQDILTSSFAIARMNVFIHDMEAEIALGDTMSRPAFLNPDGTLCRFDKVTANPMWNQDFPLATYEHDTYGRFSFGIPPSSSADWGWIQHMFASLKDPGKMAVVLDTGAVSRGSGNQGSNRERDIRKAFVERDAVEAVLLLPENLFYNTTAPGIILVMRRGPKPLERKGQILLINASQAFAKGRPKNYLTDEHIAAIADIYLNWREITEGSPLRSRIITNEEAARNDYNLSPSRYAPLDNKEEVLPLEEAMVLLEEAEEERTEAERALKEVIKILGLSESGDVTS
ncbi:N-6 DNA methylase [Thermanaerothrix sp.]|uniref:type I restriction-modification system subunit M n=1 Tax=Thermanaerothrix sp. TaxID=2972675 RepID=UPI003C7CC414